MPYFKRLPFAETMLQEQAEAPAHISTPDAQAEPFLGLANAVLGQETEHGGTRVDGPFNVRSPVQPGATGHMVLSLENPDTARPTTLQVSPSSLQSAAGNRIGADCVTATPARLSIPAGDADDIAVAINVPADTKPGVYSGSLAVTGGATNPQSFAIQIVIDVQ